MDLNMASKAPHGSHTPHGSHKPKLTTERFHDTQLKRGRNLKKPSKIQLHHVFYLQKLQKITKRPQNGDRSASKEAKSKAKLESRPPSGLRCQELQDLTSENGGKKASKAMQHDN